MRCFSPLLFIMLTIASTAVFAETQPKEVEVFLHSRQVLGAVQFTEGSVELTAIAKKEIDRIIVKLLEIQKTKCIIRVEGFSNQTGTDEINVPVSLLRAKAVVDYIRKQYNLGSNFYLTGYASGEVGISSKFDTGCAEIAVYDAALDLDQIIVEKTILR